MKFNKLVWCLGLVFAATTCFAQMYTVMDLGTLGGVASDAWGINASGQVIGWSHIANSGVSHGFRTAPNTPINPATDDLLAISAEGINASGQVVGWDWVPGGYSNRYAYRTAPNSPLNPATDNLGSLGGSDSFALAINDSGQVVGGSSTIGTAYHAFRTAPNSTINPATDDLGTLYGSSSVALAINASDQVAGFSDGHAFRTAPNSPINPATDDLGIGEAHGINATGQVVGVSNGHAFRTAPNSPINPATDDLGTLGGTNSMALAINSSGVVVGQSGTINGNTHGFLYSGDAMHDLNNLIPADSGWELGPAFGINDAGQIAGVGTHNGQQRAFLLTPVIPYKAFVQQPINADGLSVFSAKRGVVPVKFTLTENDASTCTLPTATIAVTRTSDETSTSIGESLYSTPADSGSNFRIDPTACQYVYNLAASSLGAGTYRVDISINGIMVGHAVFALK